MSNAFFLQEQAKDDELRLASNVKNHWLPHQFYPRKYAVDTSRSLKIITHDEHIFILLHRLLIYYFFILNNLSRLITLLKTLTSLGSYFLF